VQLSSIFNTLGAAALTGALAIAFAVAGVGGASASDSARPQAFESPPRSEWMSLAALTAKLESQGYSIREIETEDGVYQLEMIDPQGLRVEAYLNPVTGEALENWEGDDR